MMQLPGMPAQLRALVQKRVRKNLSFLHTDPQVAAEEAKLMINGMLEEAEGKLENTTENCKHSIAGIKGMIVKGNTDMANIRATLSMAIATKAYNSHEVEKLQ